MTDFHLIDLMSQHEAVRECLRGMSDAAIVQWFATHGRLTRRVVGGRDVFDFEFSTGMRTVFFIDDGEIVLVSDHATLT